MIQKIKNFLRKLFNSNIRIGYNQTINQDYRNSEELIKQRLDELKKKSR